MNENRMPPAPRALLLLLAATLLSPGDGQGQRRREVTFEPSFTGGVAFSELDAGLAEPYGAFGVEIQVEKGPLEYSGELRRFLVPQSCVDTDPPQCGTDVPAGYLLSGRLGRAFWTTRSFRLSAGLGAGVGRVQQEGRGGSRREGFLSSYLNLDYFFEGFRLSLGGGFDAVRSVNLAGAKVGVGWAF